MANDDQLRAELKRLGKSPGPITDQTRPIYQRQLEKLKGEGGRQSKGSVPAGSKINPHRGTSGSSVGKASEATGGKSHVAPGSFFKSDNDACGSRGVNEQSAIAMAVDDDELYSANERARAEADISELRAEIARLEHRCQTAEQQCMQLQQERQVGFGEAYGEDVAADLLRTLDQPMLVSDVCFVTLGGESLLACRSLLAMRCPEMIEELWRQNDFVLTAKTVTGNTCDISVRRDHTVRAVKILLATNQGTPVGEQRLVYQSGELEDDKRLVDYGINYECVVHLVIRQARESEESDHESSASRDHHRAPIKCVVDMPEIPKAALKDFIVYLYSGKVSLSNDTVCGVYVLCRRFKVFALSQRALVFIEQNLDFASVWKLLEIAHTQCSDELKLLCLRFIARHNALQHLPQQLPNIAQKLLQFWQLNNHQ